MGVLKLRMWFSTQVHQFAGAATTKNQELVGSGPQKRPARSLDAQRLGPGGRSAAHTPSETLASASPRLSQLLLVTVPELLGSGCTAPAPAAQSQGLPRL